ncbi:hypothetical protein [Echinicola shivajiensis]|uniref:hypothetical protein n=1 Tax=Echinicola shivajiensis TaxID=1035916 RepID=UPI001BFC53EB|nr:hypothetical protein [Echinicola shivajiensis]
MGVNTFPSTFNNSSIGIANSFSFAFFAGVSGEVGVVNDPYGGRRRFYTVSANFGFGIDFGYNHKEIFPKPGTKYHVDNYKGNGKNLSFGAGFVGDSRGGDAKWNINPKSMGYTYKERSTSVSPLIGIPTPADIGVIYQMGRTRFW